MAAIELKGMIVAEDVLEAYRLHARWGRGAVVVAVVFLGVAAWLLLRGEFETVSNVGAWAGGMIGFIVYLLLVSFVYLPLRAKKVYRQQKSLHGEIVYRVTDAAMECDAALGRSTTPWSHYVKWKESSQMMLLYHSDTLFQIVPRRFFSSSEALETVRQLLLTNRGGT